jgi:hypothetical protein
MNTNGDKESNRLGKGTDKESRFLGSETTKSQVSVRRGNGRWVERGEKKWGSGDVTYLWMAARASA